MSRYVFVTPWKLSAKTGYLPLCDKYFEKISHYLPTEHITPPRPLKTTQENSEFLTREAKRYFESGFDVVFLDENGSQETTEEFAKQIENSRMRGHKGICFVLGEAYGLPAELHSLGSYRLLSLSKMTLAHELSFLTLLEQLYRAHTILTNHPYHHGGASPLMSYKKSLGKK